MDNNVFKGILWSQFGAAIQMLENAMAACPENVWEDRGQTTPFWHLAYHTLFFLDLYASGSQKGFQPPLPFTLSGSLKSGTSPDKAYTKPELLSYLEYGRKKNMSLVKELTDEESLKRCGFGWIDVSVGELVVYNMRHVQHHTAQLNMLLRKAVHASPEWIFKADSANPGS